jgi:alkylhydroperoxidase family enzyme
MTGSFLNEPPVSEAAQALYDEDVADDGYVMNATRLWAHQPDTMKQLFVLMSQAFRPSGLSFRQRGILVIAAASALGDSYCSLAWSGKLGEAEDPALAAAVLAGASGADAGGAGDASGDGGAGLTAQEAAMAAWARKVARDPNGTQSADVQELRDAGFDDGQIFAITVFVALRLAFSTVNDALGAQPDGALAQALPPEVREAVTFGRPVAS